MQNLVSLIACPIAFSHSHNKKTPPCRLVKLYDLSHYLNGQQEADAFANREYVKLHMSTLRKVDVFANILNRAINNTLKVKSKWTEIYGVSIQGILNFCKDTWWIQLIWTVISMVLGAVIGEFIGNLL